LSVLAPSNGYGDCPWPNSGIIQVTILPLVVHHLRRCMDGLLAALV
jgi:hypothetical protein